METSKRANHAAESPGKVRAGRVPPPKILPEPQAERPPIRGGPLSQAGIVARYQDATITLWSDERPAFAGN